jgi:hypothetical protein
MASRGFQSSPGAARAAARSNGSGGGGAHPSARIDMIVDGSGFRDYIYMNREHRSHGAAYLEDAASMLVRELRRKGSPAYARAMMLGLDVTSATNQLGRALKQAGESDVAAAKLLTKAYSIYVGMWGEPGMRAAGRGFDPSK